jgi:branched-chain amino acid transport system ATP-binding protein
MLRLNNIEVMFDNVILVLRGVSIEVPEGSITTGLGANGAGKTTTLKAISALLYPERGAVTRGSIEYHDQRIDQMRAHDVVKLGIVQVFEGRRVFEHLSCEENLIVGAHTVGSTAEMKRSIERVYEYFPRIAERRTGQAGYLSGGEQQMLAIGRALMSNPKMVMLDEPSLGLAPMIIEEIFGIILRLNKEQGVTLLLVEQNANLALNIADHAYVMESGGIVMDGPAKDLLKNSDIKEFYLGIGEGGDRKSYRDVKHYRRRKRWLS